MKLKAIELYVENFQSLKSAHLKFEPGLTTISGSNSMGKTALFRSLKSFYFNEANARFIRKHENQLSVTVTHIGETDTHTATIQRVMTGKDTSRTNYIFGSEDVDGDAYEKVGRHPLPRVGEEFGIFEVEVPSAGVVLQPTFWSQEESPFLLSLTPAKAYDFFSQEPSLLQTLASLREQAKTASSTMKTEETKISTLRGLHTQENERLEALAAPAKSSWELLNNQPLFENLRQLDELVDSLEVRMPAREAEYSHLLSLNHRLGVLSLVPSPERAIALSGLIEQAVSSIDYNARMRSQMVSISNRLELLSTVPEISGLSRLENLISELTTTHEATLAQKELVLVTEGKEKALGALPESLEELTKLDGLISSITKTILDSEGIGNAIATLGQKIEEIDLELSTFEFCPHCNQPL